MSKIICDICGTSYPDTAECCPICGCSKDSAADLLTEDILDETKDKTAKKVIFDYDEANSQPKAPSAETEEDDVYDEEEEDGEEPRHNTFIVILLTILIVAMLICAGFIFVRYFLPNLGGKDETVPAVTETQQAPAESTELRIACETLVLNSGSQADLGEAGFSHLINVLVVPENTTDELVFASADQSIATVSEDGKITAVGEGETVVTITCGNVQAYVNVVCDFTPETEATEETAEATGEGEAAEETTGETTDETAGETTDETAGEATDETTGESEGSKEVDPSIKLKLKKTDIRLGVYYEYRLELDCDLDARDVEWRSEHPHIAKVDEEGNVTALLAGTTGIIAKYGDQEVQCIVRCF